MRLFVRNSIGSKILAAFLAMGVIAGVVGAYGYLVLSAAGDMVVETYDRPLMSINFARAASLDFAQMQNYALERRQASPSETADIDQGIEDSRTALFEDLAVARERSSEGAELVVIDRITSLVHAWDKARLDAGTGTAARAELQSLGRQVIEQFDTLIELKAGSSFVGRRKAVWAIGYYKYASVAITVLALLLAFGITLVLARKIVRPLSSAAAVADLIADGQLQTPIPNGAQDETGVLLRSMTVMQDSIRQMVEREQARARSAEARLIEALENSGEGIVLAGPDGDVIIANSQVSRFFPDLGRELRGLPFELALHLFDTRLPPEQETPVPLSNAITINAEEPVTAERQLADGRWIKFDGNRTNEGGFILVMTDFSVFKNREAALRAAKQAAEEASAAKSRFLANMSHELRTPLNAIIGFSEIISGQIFGAIANARYVDYANDILRSGQHLRDVINSVLDLARSEAGNFTLHPQPVDMREILKDCAMMLAVECASAKLTLRVPDVDTPVMVFGEQAKLRQIVLNLLSNAVKFTNAGGSIAIELTDSEAPGEWVSVSVIDTGIGMSPDDVKVALTPFGQVDSGLGRRYEGTGLGLPLTKTLVELHGGVLIIDSARGKGTSVTVRLPAAAQADDSNPVQRSA